MCGFLVVGSEEFKLQEFNDALDKAAYRGPDHQHISVSNGITWGFNRLSIMDLSTNGNQPFVYKDCTLVCNGEIYNYPELKNKLSKEYTFKSGSDCEVLIPLYDQYGIEILCKYLDAEFAMVLYDTKTKQIQWVFVQCSMVIVKKNIKFVLLQKQKLYLIYVMILCLFHQDIII